MRKLKIAAIAIVVIAAGVTAYIQGKQYVTRQEVKEYLAEKGEDIEEMDSFIANLPGDMNWMVGVKTKAEPGYFYYYYDRDKKEVVLESYTLNGEEFDSPETAKSK